MIDHHGYRTSVIDKDSIISAISDSFWKAFNLLMSDFGDFIHLLSASNLINIIVVFMLQIYGF